MVTDKRSWNDSKHNCIAMGARLMEVHTQEDFDTAKNFRQKVKESYWLGASDILAEGNWTWDSNKDEVSLNEFWYAGRPYNNTRTNCMAMSSRLFDWTCHRLYMSLCEFKGMRIDVDLL